jgi:hypothetical protein
MVDGSSRAGAGFQDAWYELTGQGQKVGKNNPLKNAYLWVSPTYGGIAYEVVGTGANLGNAWAVGTQLANMQSTLPWQPIAAEGVSSVRVASPLPTQFGETVASGPLNHINGAIAEAQGWQVAVANGEIGIQPPGKVTATGLDFITYDPVTDQINIWDAKYSRTQAWPRTAAGFGSKAWLTETSEAISQMSDAAQRAKAQAAFDAGRINWNIFTWPK